MHVGSYIFVAVGDCTIKSSVAKLVFGIEVDLSTISNRPFDDGLNHSKTANLAGSHETGVFALSLLVVEDG
jgi:hypothetical protein